ncbi:Peptidyl-tRNA hydrolase [Phaffia rhodozyma]|uniref:Peptidyl-tRNA hydrolase n=1 Tax=Phaffia rhodozyma TaxID=264483 RepID=A0A0F7ST97_PHARH|nr:Peptidyl-tRNA hydrolase [Phaffia rhodozyma]
MATRALNTAQKVRSTIPPHASTPPPVRPTTHINHIVCFGLGNLTHPRTRHSLGHVIVDSFLDRLGLGIWKKSANLKSMIAEGSLPLPDHVDAASGHFDSVKLTLVKNIPPMNLAGQSLQPFLRQNPINRSTLYFFLYDHLDAEEGKIQIRRGGSCGGQKGMKSCLGVLGKHDKETYQIRVGIGKPSSTDFTASYVLSRCTAPQLSYFRPDGEGTISIWNSILEAAYPSPGSDKIVSVGKKKEDMLQASAAKKLRKEAKAQKDAERRKAREAEATGESYSGSEGEQLMDRSKS